MGLTNFLVPIHRFHVDHLSPPTATCSADILYALYSRIGESRSPTGGFKAKSNALRTLRKRFLYVAHDAGPGKPVINPIVSLP